jgi:hypothetical protein
MKVVRRQITSWEPLEIRFVPKVKKAKWEKEVFSWFLEWDKNRAILAKGCPSTGMPLEAYVAHVKPDGTAVVHIEWLDEKALPIFSDFIRRTATNVKRMEIGEDPDFEPEVKIEMPGPEVEFMRIPEKVIFTETRKNVKVASFEISRFPITVGQFDRFVKATGYKTTNEQTGYYLTYRDNDLLIGMSKKVKMATPATCLSYNDAMAYCEWRDFRLPFDAEWLSASVLDWETEYKNENLPYEAWVKLTAKPEALKRLAAEWVCDPNDKDGTSAIRYGPGYYLYRGWKRKKLRRRQPTDFTDLLLQFRVCRK